MNDVTHTSQDTELRIDARVLRHMMLETIDLLGASADHADEACMTTDAAMALTRVDWMLMAVFNWLTRQLRTDGTASDDGQAVGKPVSIIGIETDSLSPQLRDFMQTVDRLHARAQQLESLVNATAKTEAESKTRRSTGIVLNIFGDPKPEQTDENPVLATRKRLNWALCGN